MKRGILLLFVLTLAACLPIPATEAAPTPISARQLTPADNPYAPADDDIRLQRGGVTINSVNLAERLDLTPRRVTVYFIGSMPSVCSELRVEVRPPDNERRIFIEIYSLMDPSAACERVFQRFEAAILLGTYTDGRYTVWVNGELVGDFTVY